MSEKKTRGRQIHVEMPADEYSALKALATELDLSMQQLARRVFRVHMAYLERAVAYKDTSDALKLVAVDREQQ
ncbi:hypothetical protein L6Q82_04205 [Burkholderia cenocepacia]|uniref:hypothetical protein n=1 Tax=Burkholderia cenocepacia TaxID=95486 RepID=UPI001F161A1B|nr:hypothetical protein [Burkholderia cenocepacia]MCG0577138.1 hypothetical protein [Burkholderia cenocepacia]